MKKLPKASKRKEKPEVKKPDKAKKKAAINAAEAPPKEDKENFDLDAAVNRVKNRLKEADKSGEKKTVISASHQISNDLNNLFNEFLDIEATITSDEAKKAMPKEMQQSVAEIQKAVSILDNETDRWDKWAEQDIDFPIGEK